MTDLLVLGSGVAGLTAALHARGRGPVGARAHEGRALALRDAVRAGWRRGRARPNPIPPSCTSATRSSRAPTCATRPRSTCSCAKAPIACASSPRSARGSTITTAAGCSHAKAVTRWRASCTRAATRPAPRSSARSSPPRSRRAARSAKAGSHSRCSSSTARPPGSSRSTRRAGRSKCRATDTVIATGGAGQCYAVTTNPALSTGDGIALALRARVACADMEFVQFHPTALHHPAMPRPLLSEALRGEGALLRDGRGDAFMRAEHPLADLAPRDVVARAIHFRMRDEGSDHVWLDATGIDDFASRFPTIWQRVPAGRPRPDERVAARSRPRRTTCRVACSPTSTARPRCPGLWTCGEAACSGVHGANRLASNSLLDGLVFGARVVAAIAKGKRGPEPTGAMSELLASGAAIEAVAPEPPEPVDPRQREAIEARDVERRRSRARCRRPRARGEVAGRGARRRGRLGASRSVAAYEVANLTTVASAIVAGATARLESRGSHARADFPATDAAQRGRYVQLAGDAPRFVALRASGTGVAVVSAFDPPAPTVRALVASALAEDLGVLGDITTLACIADDAAGPGPVRRPVRGCRRRHRAPRPRRSSRSTRRWSSSWQRRRRRRGRSRRRDRHRRGTAAVDPHGRAGRAQLPDATSRVSRRSPAASCARRTGAPASSTPARRFPGLRAFEKAAVRAGGGFNHRESLSDAVLIKDNHLVGLGVTGAIERARARWPNRIIEVECDSLEQVAEAKSRRPRHRAPRQHEPRAWCAKPWRCSAASRRPR